MAKPLLNYCLVTQNLASIIEDSIYDSDRFPDVSDISGEVIFTPNIANGKAYQLVDSEGKSYTVPVSRVRAEIIDGVITHEHRAGVYLFAAGAGSNPDKITYSVEYRNLRSGELSFSLSPLKFEAIPGGEVDLTTATPVVGATPAGVVRGPRGTSLEAIVVDGSELVFTAVDDVRSFEISRIPIDDVVRSEADAAAILAADGVRVEVEQDADRAEAAANRADTKVDTAINAGAALVRDEVKQDADRAEAAANSTSVAITEWDENVAAIKYAKTTPVDVRLSSELGVSPTDTDAGQTITEALNSLPEGATLYLEGDYITTTPIIVSKPVAIFGPAKITAQHDMPLFDVKSNDVSFDGGLQLVGRQRDTYISDARGISCIGGGGSYYENIHIGKVHIEGFAGGGVTAKFVRNLTTSEGLIVERSKYWGVGLLSCDTVNMVRPVVRDVEPLSSTNTNAYGITATHSDGTPENSPSTVGVTIEEPLIEDVPTWAGIDTHGGKKITVLRPTIRRCLWGISLVSGPGEDGSEQRAPLDFLIDSPHIEDCSGYGIGVSGASAGLGDWVELATGIIQNPTLIRCGNPDSNNSGAVWLRSTNGVRLTGLRAFEPGSHGVCLQYNNFEFHIEDVVVVDPWSNTHTLPSVIAQRSSYNTGTIESFRGLLGGKTATNVLKFGLHSGTATETSINLGTSCVVDSGILVYEAGSVKRITFESQASVIKLGRWQSDMGFYGATPVARPVVAASATDSATTQALVNEIRANLVSLGLFK